MIETGMRVRSDGVCLAWWIEESSEVGEERWMGGLRMYFGRCYCRSWRRRKNGSHDLRQCPGLLLGNWSLVWRCMRWSVWLDGERSLVAESCLGLAVCLPCSDFYVSPNPRPSLPLSLPSSTVSLVPASLLGCEAPTLFLPMSGDHFREGKRNSFRFSIFIREEAEGRWGKPTFSHVHIAFSFLFSGKVYNGLSCP